MKSTHYAVDASIREILSADACRKIHEAQDLRAQGLPTLPSSIALELETNPFLRTLQAPVAQAASLYAGHELDSSVAVFAALREWKNQA